MPAPPSRRALVALAALLALFGLRLVDGARLASFTNDEPHYAATGLYLWQSGDYHWFHSLLLMPPLGYHLASLPLLALDTSDLVLQRNAGFHFVESARHPLTSFRVASRLPFVLLTAWGALLVFAWAREVAGDEAGLIAAALCTLSPVVAGYGGLAHSDMLLAVCYFQTLYTFWRWWRTPTPARLFLCGASLGLAVAAKGNALLLPPTLAIVLAAALWRPGAREPAPPADVRARIGYGAGVLAAIGAVALVVVWLAYGGGFGIGTEPDGPFADVPLPGYLRVMLMNQVINTDQRTFYLFGAMREPAWYFLPLMFALKTPLPTLVLTAAAAWRRSQAFHQARLALFLGAPAALYAAVACFGIRVPAGVRFLLPLHLLLFVFVGTRLAGLERRWQRAAVGVSLAVLALISLRAHPHEMAYFNALAGGTGRAHRVLADSNLDWGQDLGTLAAWHESVGRPPLRGALFSVQRPEAFGLDLLPLDGCRPAAGGWVAISASIRHGLYDPDSYFRRPPPGCYDWLDRQEPALTLGGSILLYDLRDDARPGNRRP